MGSITAGIDHAAEQHLITGTQGGDIFFLQRKLQFDHSLSLLYSVTLLCR